MIEIHSKKERKNMKQKSIFSISSILTSLLLIILITVVGAFAFGFRAFLVVGWSSEPDIKKDSLIVDYKTPYEQLQIGDYVTHYTIGSNGKKALTTHSIVKLAREEGKEYFEKDEYVEFENLGVVFRKRVDRKCQVITMTNNPNQLATSIEAYNSQVGEKMPITNGPGIECKMYKELEGKVIYSSYEIGKFIFYIKNNFMQIIFYVIIFYIATELLSIKKDYEKNY